MKSVWNNQFLKQNYYREKEISFARETFEFIKKQNTQNQKILDLGCGQGQDSIFFADNGFQVTAMDWSKEALSSIVDKRIKKVCQDMRDLSTFKPKTFDVVYCVFSIHFFRIEESQKIIDQIQQVLKQDGLLALIAKNTEDKYYGKGQQIAQHTFIYKNVLRHFFTEKELREMLKNFKITSCEEEKHDRDGITSYWKIFAQL